MDTRYHAELTRRAMAADFSPAAIEDVVRANLGQDALRYQLGAHAHFHFDNNRIAESRAYVEVQYVEALTLALAPGGAVGARRALGRLLHAVQDFYAHSNYVDLWLAAYTEPGTSPPPPETIDALDPALLAHPDLITGTFVFWRDIIYLVLLIGDVARRIWVHPTSHEAMNLDSPRQGWRFDYAHKAAYRRTEHECRRLLNAIAAVGGPALLSAFTGL